MQGEQLPFRGFSSSSKPPLRAETCWDVALTAAEDSDCASSRRIAGTPTKEEAEVTFVVEETTNKTEDVHPTEQAAASAAAISELNLPRGTTATVSSAAPASLSALIRAAVQSPLERAKADNSCSFLLRFPASKEDFLSCVARCSTRLLYCEHADLPYTGVTEYFPVLSFPGEEEQIATIMQAYPETAITANAESRTSESAAAVSALQLSCMESTAMKDDLADLLTRPRAAGFPEYTAITVNSAGKYPVLGINSGSSSNSGPGLSAYKRPINTALQQVGVRPHERWQLAATDVLQAFATTCQQGNAVEKLGNAGGITSFKWLIPVRTAFTAVPRRVRVDSSGLSHTCESALLQIPQSKWLLPSQICHSITARLLNDAKQQHRRLKPAQQRQLQSDHLHHPLQTHRFHAQTHGGLQQLVEKSEQEGWKRNRPSQIEDHLARYGHAVGIDDGWWLLGGGSGAAAVRAAASSRRKRGRIKEALALGACGWQNQNSSTGARETIRKKGKCLRCSSNLLAPVRRIKWNVKRLFQRSSLMRKCTRCHYVGIDYKNTSAVYTAAGGHIKKGASCARFFTACTAGAAPGAGEGVAIDFTAATQSEMKFHKKVRETSVRFSRRRSRQATLEYNSVRTPEGGTATTAGAGSITAAKVDSHRDDPSQSGNAIFQDTKQQKTVAKAEEAAAAAAALAESTRRTDDAELHNAECSRAPRATSVKPQPTRRQSAQIVGRSETHLFTEYLDDDAYEGHSISTELQRRENTPGRADTQKSPARQDVALKLDFRGERGRAEGYRIGSDESCHKARKGHEKTRFLSFRTLEHLLRLNQITEDNFYGRIALLLP